MIRKLAPFAIAALLAACAEARLDVTVDIYGRNIQSPGDEAVAQNLFASKAHLDRTAEGLKAMVDEFYDAVATALVISNLHLVGRKAAAARAASVAAPAATPAAEPAAPAAPARPEQPADAIESIESLTAPDRFLARVRAGFKAVVKTRQDAAGAAFDVAFAHLKGDFPKSLESQFAVQEFYAKARDMIAYGNDLIRFAQSDLADINAGTNLSHGISLDDIDPDYRDAIAKQRTILAARLAAIAKTNTASADLDGFRMALETSRANVAEALRRTDGYATSGLKAMWAGKAALYDELNSLVDRVQNPADPALRILADDPDDPNWKTVFAKTSYLAEGNSSVALIRERPGHFVVKHASNNPRALIQGQMQITRAVATTAVKFAGAVAGVPLPAPLDSLRPSDGTSTMPSRLYASSKPAIDAAIAQRRDTRKRFAVSLEDLTDAVDGLGSVPAATDATATATYQEGLASLRRRIDAHLAVHAEWFAPAPMTTPTPVAAPAPAPAVAPAKPAVGAVPIPSP